MLQNRVMNKTRGWIVAPVFALAGLVFMGQHARAAAPIDAVVNTQAGSVQGRAEGALLTFKGVPYAAPPVGELRWRAPQPAAPWQGTRPALERGASCIQKPSLSIDSGAGDPRPMDEDCLFLNVWTPRAEPTAKLPVMVWIHGGALIFGAGGLPIYDGTPLAQRGAVVVTINYRLGSLGFFAHPSIAGAKPGADVNFGLLDQIAALKWVQRNIATFGGDPGNVTIFGQSAGAESVLALFASPLARGLFHKGIAQSPYGIPSHTLAKARATAATVATALQLEGANATAAELRAVPAEAFDKLDGAELSLAPGFILGDAAMPKPILSVFQSGGEAPVPLIIGNTSDDGSIAVEFGMDPAAIVKRLGAARIAVKSLYPKGLSDELLGRQTVRDLVFTAFARRIAYLHTARAPT
jgi:para-nitrobenzyl esterase